MEYYFSLILCTYFFIIFTFSKRLFISLHFAKETHENRSGESRITACQTLWGSKSKVAETQFPNPSCPGS